MEVTIAQILNQVNIALRNKDSVMIIQGNFDEVLIKTGLYIPCSCEDDVILNPKISAIVKIKKD